MDMSAVKNVHSNGQKSIVCLMNDKMWDLNNLTNLSTDQNHSIKQLTSVALTWLNLSLHPIHPFSIQPQIHEKCA